MESNSWLGKPKGVFHLSESDKYVGSFFSKEDLKIIFHVSDEEVKKLPFDKCTNSYIDEKKIKLKRQYKFLYKKIKYGNRASFDEFVLAAIIRQCYPNAVVIQQYNWKDKKTADIYVKIDNRTFIIEFLGPSHFVDKNKIREDIRRQKEIEKKVQGCRCFLWPYWIQRCALNVKILFGDEKYKNGRGALWSSKCYFGDFDIDNPSQIIHELTDPFKAAPYGNFGYFYEGCNTDSLVKPEHFIINDILLGEKDYHRLIPSGISESEENNWLPQSIIDYKNEKR